METYFDNYEDHLVDIDDDLVSLINDNYNNKDQDKDKDKDNDEYQDKPGDYTKEKIIKDLSTYYMYSLPLSLHACIPTQKLPDTYESFRNNMIENITSFKGNIYIACGTDDTNTLYNVEFRDLYNNLISLCKDKKEITTLSIEGFGHSYIREDVANEMLLEIVNCMFNNKDKVKEYNVLERIELYPDDKRKCKVHINNPQFNYLDDKTGYNNPTIKRFFKNIMVLKNE